MQSIFRNRCLVLLTSAAIITVFSLQVFSSAKSKKKKKQHGDKSAAVLWRNPGNIRNRDLYYGPGAKELAPVAPFHFLKEVKEGTIPKFDVEDARGVKWRVKLGPEAQAETVSSRLIWAVGYNAEEAYYFDRARIDGLTKLSRGQKYVEGDSVRGARFEPRRKNIERGKQWDWSKNPFKGTRELNGLKTMIVLLNDWDVLKQNNKILHVKDPAGKVESRYTVTDLDTTLGAVGGFGRHRSENNVRDFERRRLVSKVDKGQVKFNYDLKPKRFGLISLFYPPYYFRQRKATNTMNKVPVEHAAWIGSQLAQLSDNQLRDTFRAAGYDRATTERYVHTLRGRINELNQLRDTQVAVRARRVR